MTEALPGTEQQRLWSVTTLIGEGLPKPALLNWVGRTVAEYAVDEVQAWQALAASDREAAVELLVNSRYRKTRRAAERGAAVHEFAEQVALGIDFEEDDFTPPHFEQYKRFLEDHAPAFLAAEAPVVNLTYHYAGTLDAIVQIAGATVVLDVKTTDRGPDARARPPYPEVALQLAAYAHAERICLTPLPRDTGRGGKRYYFYDAAHPQDEMPAVDGALVLVLSPFDYQLKPVAIDDRVWRTFLHVREVARWQLDTSRSVFGPTIAPSTPGRSPADVTEGGTPATDGLPVETSGGDDQQAAAEQNPSAAAPDQQHEDETWDEYIERLGVEAAANGGQVPAASEAVA